MTTLMKPTARAASTALTFEHASDFAASADNAIKRMCDIIASLIGIILLTPVWIIVAAMVRLHDGVPLSSSRSAWASTARVLPCLSSAPCMLMRKP